MTLRDTREYDGGCRVGAVLWCQFWLQIRIVVPRIIFILPPHRLYEVRRESLCGERILGRT